MKKLLLAALLLALLPSLAHAQGATALRPDQITPATPDVTWAPGGTGYQIGSTIPWRTDGTTTPTICTGSGTGSGPGAASCTTSDNARVLELTNTAAISATLPAPAAPMGDGTGFRIQVGSGTLALHNNTGNLSGVAVLGVGPWQSVDLLSRSGVWYATVSAVPTVAAGVITFVQTLPYQSGGTATTYTTSPLTGVTAGNTLVTDMAWNNTGTVSSVTATNSWTCTLGTNTQQSPGVNSAIAWCKGGASGSVSVTWTISASSAYANIDIVEFSGVTATSPDIGVGKVYNTGTQPVTMTTNGNTSKVNDLIFSMMTNNGSTSETVNSPATKTGNQSAYSFATAAGVSASHTWNLTGGTQFVGSVFVLTHP